MIYLPNEYFVYPYSKAPSYSFPSKKQRKYKMLPLQAEAASQISLQPLELADQDLHRIVLFCQIISIRKFLTSLGSKFSE